MISLLQYGSMLFEQYAAEPREIKIFGIVDHTGKCDEAKLPRVSPEFVKQMYEEMVFARMADDKVLKLQRQGRMGTYASMKGQEAAQVGSVHALDKKTDWVVPAFRELAAMHLHGVPLEDIYRYWGGFELGSKMPEGVNVLPISIPVGTHMLHAVGISWAMKLQKKNGVAMTFFSDGATSEGDFHEAMNFAGVFRTPTVFLCQNNQYAISFPRKKQTAAKTLAQKAMAYGMPGMMVDGNDALAVYAASMEAVSRARAGEGPFFIEAVTYRQADHTTADDSTKYRSKEETEYWLLRDPIKRMQIWMKSKNWWDAQFQTALEERSTKKINQAVELYEKTPVPGVEYIFEHTYAQLTPQLHEQLEYLRQFYV